MLDDTTEIRNEIQQKKLWRAAAALTKFADLSAWMRARLDEAARRDLATSSSQQ